MEERNYALKAGKKFFCYFDTVSETMTILDISETGTKFLSRAEWLINGDLCHSTLTECISDLKNYSKPVIYHGKNLNVWQESIFVTVNPHTGEMYRQIYFDDGPLKEAEREAMLTNLAA